MKLTQSVKHTSYMSHEGDALALWLNKKARSPLGQALKWFHSARQYAVEKRTKGIGVLTGPFVVKFQLDQTYSPSGKYGFRIDHLTEKSEATFHLLTLATTQQLHRLRRCEHCHKWYFARREMQRFCTVNCRVKAHVSLDPVEVRRRKRAKYMRDYRNREKEKDRKAIENLRKKGNKQ